MRGYCKFFILIFIGFTLGACAGGSNLVMEPNKSEYRSRTVTLGYAGSTVNIPEKASGELKKYMQARFFKEGTVFKEGDGLTIRYQYVSYDEGSQAARYFLGVIGGGEAKMVVQAEFLDPEGTVLAKIQSEGRLSGGVFGGDAGSAINRAAHEIAEFAEANFAQ